jgi:hypothetical protein
MTPLEYNARLAEAWQERLGRNGSLNPAGEIIMADLIESGAVLKPLPMVNARTGEVDALALGIAEGRRQVVLRIIDALKLDPTKVRATQEIWQDGNP